MLAPRYMNWFSKPWVILGCTHLDTQLWSCMKNLFLWNICDEDDYNSCWSVSWETTEMSLFFTHNCYMSLYGYTCSLMLTISTFWVELFPFIIKYVAADRNLSVATFNSAETRILPESLSMSHLLMAWLKQLPCHQWPWYYIETF